MSEKLLIVEDDKKLNDGIRLALKNDAYFFYQCRTLQEAREILKKEDITLVLLDVNLPDGNGIDFVREIRKNSQVPIILLTVNNMEVDIVTGLEAGANDYITKPFSLMVLRARVSVQLRNKEAAAKNSMELDGFEFYFDKMEFFKDGEPIELSKTEQKLLAVLLVVVGAKQILINTLGTAFFFRLHLTIVPCVLMIPILVGIAYVIPKYQFEKMSQESVVERIRKE